MINKLRLCYLVEGTPETLSISVRLDSDVPMDVDDLRQLLFDRTLKNWAPHPDKISLLKVNVNLVHPGDHLPLLRFNKGDEGVEELFPEKELSEIWPEPPPAHRIHLFVSFTKLIQEMEGPRKHLEAGYLVYYKFWWGDGLDSLLQPVPGSNLKYLPKQLIDSLKLERLQFNESVLLVREEYKVAYSFLESHEAKEKPFRGGGRVVSGQPGIGKTCFLYYLLFRLLSQRKKVAFQLKDEFLLFEDTGVRICSFVASNESILPDRVWALTDSLPGRVFDKPCEAFLSAIRSSSAWVVQTTSPLETRWKQWSREYGAKMYWMDIFTVDEMHALGLLLGLNPKVMREFYDLWGPSARNCVEYARKIQDMASYENDVLLAARALIKKDSDLTSPKELSPTHRIFVVRPSPDSRQIACVDYGTKRLREISGRAYTKQENADRYSFYRTIRSHPWFAAPAGHMYEAHVLLWVCHAQDTATLPCTGALANSRNLEIPSCPGNVMFIEYAHQLTEIKEPERSMCLITTSRSFPTLDAVILTSDAVITAQITISPKHDAKRAGFDLVYHNLPGELLDKRPYRYHVFITDEDSNAKKLRAQNRKGIPYGALVYSTVIGVSDLDSQAPATEDRLEALEKAREPQSEAMKTDNWELENGNSTLAGVFAC